MSCDRFWKMSNLDDQHMELHVLTSEMQQCPCAQRWPVNIGEQRAWKVPDTA